MKKAIIIIGIVLGCVCYGIRETQEFPVLSENTTVAYHGVFSENDKTEILQSSSSHTGIFLKVG
jgi:hypothetical protein